MAKREADALPHIPMMVNVPLVVRRAVESAADKQGTTMSDVVRQALQEYVNTQAEA